MNGYTITDNLKVEEHITFIRINPTDIKITLKEVFDSLSNLSWISSFDEEYMRSGYEAMANDSIAYIAKNIIKENDDEITSKSGETVVSELARKSIVDKLDYLDIPLGELIKIKESGNHGFDFFTKNHDDIILFGEAKYLASQNAYGSAFKQIVRFESLENKDKKDIIDVDRFFCETSKRNHANGQKGFVAAFASKNTTTDNLIKKIKENKHFKELTKFNELICVAVNV